MVLVYELLDLGWGPHHLPPKLLADSLIVRSYTSRQGLGDSGIVRVREELLPDIRIGDDLLRDRFRSVVVVECSLTSSDPPEAQFERLLAAADANPRVLDWLEIMDPEADFQKAAIDTMISWECDVYVPLASR